MRKIVMIVFCIMAGTMIFFACQKDKSPVNRIAEPPVAEMKEWYYGSFRRSPEYNSLNRALSGKKIPDWNRGRAIKIGTYDVVEFPLIKSKSNFAFNTDVASSTADNMRVAAAS